MGCGYCAKASKSLIGDNDHLSLRALSKKLALLMALMDARRTSELQALDLRFKRFRPEGVYFTLAALNGKWEHQ